MKKCSIAVFVLIIIGCIRTYAQGDSSMNGNSQGAQKDAFMVSTAGSQYNASRWKMLWWGKHYRKEWTTPVSFPVLHLSTFEGGFQPLKEGGGHESRSLRLLSSDGKEYVLRTMDKNLNILVPDEFKGSVFNDIVNDQISTAHPYGGIAVAKMAGSLSFMHASPVLYYVADDPALGTFRGTFANKLCFLEERPSGKGWEHTAMFGDIPEIVNTQKMFTGVYESSKRLVDQPAFLKVRLFDMTINDWDRHEDQWAWAVQKTDDHTLYSPIARDRDQAFSKTEGITMYFLSRRWSFRFLQNMDSHIRDVAGMNFGGRNLDRQFLNELTLEDWKKGVSFIQENLTDSSITSAINSMPAEVNKISGNFLIHRLMQRRNNLMKDALRYYSIISKQVTINGSAENEQFIVNRDKENEVSVTGLRSETDTFYHRVFYRHETKQINIYALGGDDKYIVQGNAANHFTIRMIGGDGKNQYVATENSHQGKAYRVYDSLFQEKPSPKVFWSNKTWDTAYRYNRAFVKYDWCLPLIVPYYNPDDGVAVSLGVLFKKQQWGKTPFGWQQQLTLDYASGTGAIGFSYNGLFKQTFGKWDFDLDAYYKGPRYTFNYYGFGNETELNDHNKSYFRVKANDLFVSPGIVRTWKKTSLRFGLQYNRVDVLRSQEKFITSAASKLDSSVFSSINFSGVSGQWKYSTAHSEIYPTKGFHFTGGFSFLNNLNNTNRQMVKLNGAISFNYTFFDRLTFSHRTGANTIFGDYEFYQASALGGSQNLRGYWRNRFAGKSDFYQNTDLRLNLCDFKGYALRGKFGLVGFIDDGRVWIKDENSSKIHTGYGGGIFLLPYNYATLCLYYAKSREANIVALRTGFFF